MTSQEQLRRYDALRKVEKEAAAAVERAKKELLKDWNGEVEPGSIHCKVDVRESQSFSYDAMVDAVGRKEADRIKALMPVKSVTYLTVTAP